MNTNMNTKKQLITELLQKKLNLSQKLAPSFNKITKKTLHNKGKTYLAAYDSLHLLIRRNRSAG